MPPETTGPIVAPATQAAAAAQAAATPAAPTTWPGATFASVAPETLTRAQYLEAIAARDAERQRADESTKKFADVQAKLAEAFESSARSELRHSAEAWLSRQGVAEEDIDDAVEDAVARYQRDGAKDKPALRTWLTAQKGQRWLGRLGVKGEEGEGEEKPAEGKAPAKPAQDKPPTRTAPKEPPAKKAAESGSVPVIRNMDDIRALRNKALGKDKQDPKA